MKTYPRCGRSLDESAFGKDKRAKDGLRCWCKDCCKIADRLRREDPVIKMRNARAVCKWREAHPEQVKELNDVRSRKKYMDPKTKRWWPD